MSDVGEGVKDDVSVGGRLMDWDKVDEAYRQISLHVVQ